MLESLIPIGLSIIFFLGTAVLSSLLAGPTARLKLRDDRVEVIPLGIWKFWALRRRVKIPVDAFETVEIRRDAYELPRGVRAPGTRIPKFMIAGSYRTGELTTFFLTSRPGRAVLVADFRTDRHQRFVIQVSKPEVIKAWLVENTEVKDGEIDPKPSLASRSPARRSRSKRSQKAEAKRSSSTAGKVRKHGRNNPGVPRARQRKRG